MKTILIILAVILVLVLIPYTRKIIMSKIKELLASLRYTADEIEKEVEKLEPKPEEPIYDIIHVKGLVDGNAELGDVTNTGILRPYFKQSNSIYQLPKGRFYVHGILPEDEPDRQYRGEDGELYDVQTGEVGGTVRTINTEDVVIMGSGDNETTLYTLEPAVDKYYPNTSNRRILSGRKFIEAYKSENVFIYNIGVESSNEEPDYVPAWEHEHGIDADHTKYLHIEKFVANKLWGDGIYLRHCHHVYIKDILIGSNGRQAGALIAGSNMYIERMRAEHSERAGWDIEGNTVNDDSEIFTITYSYFDNKLMGLPMGGRGSVKNVLSINNRYMDSVLWSRGNETTKPRESIIWANSQGREFGRYDHTENVLIDGIEQDDLGFNKLIYGSFRGCENVTIRNCDMPNYGRRSKGKEPFILIWSDEMPLSAFKIYDNKQKIGVILNQDKSVHANESEGDKYYRIDNYEDVEDFWLYFDSHIGEGIVKGAKKDMILQDEKVISMKEIHFPEYTPTEEELGEITFKVPNEIQFQWDRLYTNGFGWREEDYQDDGWRPDYVLDNYKKVGLNELGK